MRKICCSQFDQFISAKSQITHTLLISGFQFFCAELNHEGRFNAFQRDRKRRKKAVPTFFKCLRAIFVAFSVFRIRIACFFHSTKKNKKNSITKNKIFLSRLQDLNETNLCQNDLQFPVAAEVLSRTL